MHDVGVDGRLSLDQRRMLPRVCFGGASGKVRRRADTNLMFARGITESPS